MWYEKDAMRGETAPAGLDVVDMLTYISLRRIYQDYKAGRITQARGIVEKEQILENRRIAEAKVNYFEQCAVSASEEFFKARRAYIKDKSAKNAKAMCETMIF